MTPAHQRSRSETPILTPETQIPRIETPIMTPEPVIIKTQRRVQTPEPVIMKTQRRVQTPEPVIMKTQRPVKTPEPVIIKTQRPVKTPEPLIVSNQAKNPPVNQDLFNLSRFCKLSISQTNPLDIIADYLNEPLTSLEEALQPFHDQIDQLANNIKKAKTECLYPSKHHLTRDESAAIYIYTMKWKNKCVYDHLEAAWKSHDRLTMKPWFKYLRLFRSALDKLPDTEKEIWQGIPYDQNLLKKLNLKTGALYSTLGLCLLSPNEIKDYLQKDTDDKVILIGYKSVHGKSITEYSVNKNTTYLIWPGTQLGASSSKTKLSTKSSDIQQNSPANNTNAWTIHPNTRVGVDNFMEITEDGSVTMHLIGLPGK
ncbi:unnamed protein product [Rotaria sordida]|uniref:Uncharacterized protein n=1 Tax=Rotaria sordida TaxID=392033 RepID=A0A819IWP0_9BILA|nr:unnamed protein product [Rotaria sordida]